MKPKTIIIKYTDNRRINGPTISFNLGGWMGLCMVKLSKSGRQLFFYSSKSLEPKQWIL